MQVKSDVLGALPSDPSSRCSTEIYITRTSKIFAINIEERNRSKKVLLLSVFPRGVNGKESQVDISSKIPVNYDYGYDNVLTLIG